MLGLAGFGGVEIARRHWQWQPTVPVAVDFPTVAGLEVGARVHVQGLDAGVVESIEPPTVPGGRVRVRLRLDRRLEVLVRSDATARIGTQGIVGAKVLEIVPGRVDAPPLAAGQSLRAEAPRELADVMRDASQALARLDAVAEAARAGLGDVDAIAASIRRGEGTIGRLVTEDDAYERLVTLSERSEAALTDLSDNLAALKQPGP